MPKQHGNWADLKAAYRLLDNDRIDPVAIGQPHRQQTRLTTTDHPLVLLVQDDTDLQAVKIEGGQHVQHTTLAVLPDGQLLGIMQQAWFTHATPPIGETRKQRMTRWRESCVWSDATAVIGPAPDGCHYLHVADRASDNLPFIAACRSQGHGFVIRARHDRRLNEDGDKLWATLQQAPALGTLQVDVGEQRDDRGRIVRRSRQARVHLATATVTLQPPWNHPGEQARQTVGAIHLREVDPPEDVEPIDWMLLTSEPVEHVEDARRIVGYYQRRWVIEEWHRVLKEGCRLEQSQIESIENLQRLAALLSIVAVRLQQLRDLADPARDDQTADDPAALQRTCPHLWIAVVAALANVDAMRLTPRRFFLAIAQQGGYLNRKRDGRVGWKVLWRGWYDITQMVRGAELMKNHPRPPGCG
jgi:hypothetical protein